MKMTTKQVIKILPFDEQFREDLVQRFDSLTEGQKLDITQLVWASYYALHKLKVQEKLALAYIDVAKDKRKLSADFYKKVREEAERELQSDESTETTKIDLSETRAQLQNVLKAPGSN